MNAVQTLNRISFYNDVTRNARYSFAEIIMAVNDAIFDFIDEKIGKPQNRTPENFQLIQLIREDIHTLITTANPTVTNGTVITNRYYSITPSHINFPADYYTFVTLNMLIDGYTDYSRPTTYNENGPLFKDSFRHPTNTKTYFNEDSTGLKIYRGVGGTVTSSTLEYLRNPVDFTIGTEANLITTGGTLTNALAYLATEISVYNGTTYTIGATITGTGAALTSGQVILTSNTVPIDLPSKTHEEIARRASVILLKNSGAYPSAQAVESQV